MLAVPSKDVPLIVRAVWSLGADTTVMTGVVVWFATVALASAELTLVTVPLPPPPEPLDAAVLRPLESTVMLVLV